MEYAVLDIESTGGKYNEEGIMEIAIFRFDGLEITDSFSALINPDRPIQAYVSQLTGINDAMLRSAPRFHEVARRIVEITTGAVIVAHNASFDYRILRTEFSRLGFDFKRPTLCTVALSQRLIPEAESHSLGKLVRSLGIPVSDRHRAHGDALATLKLLKVLLLKEGNAKAIQELIRDEEVGELSDNQLRMVQSLPEEMGLYELYDKQGTLLYVSAAKNIRQSVNQHFTARDKLNRKLQKYVKKVRHELSGSMLLAELQARSEQQVSKPRFIQKRTDNSLNSRTLHLVQNHSGFEGFLMGERDQWEEAELVFSDYTELVDFLAEACRELELCTYATGLHSEEIPCPVHPEGDRGHELTELESPETYNQRFRTLLDRYSLKSQTMILQDSGRVPGEKGFIYVREGRIAGLGYSELNLQLDSPERVEKHMRPLAHNLHNRLLVEHSLRARSSLKILYFQT